MAGLPKAKPDITIKPLTRLELEKLPRVDANGIFQSPAPTELPGVTGILDGRLVSCAVAPVNAECIYVDPNAARRYGLADLLSKGPFPVDAAFLTRLSQRFALRRVPDGEVRPDAVDLMCSLYAQSERNLGDGRGGYYLSTTPEGNPNSLFVKGIGPTPLRNPDAEAGHTNGYVGSHSALAESVWPQLFQHLFTHTTPGTIAFFGMDHFGVLDHRLPIEQAVILLRGGQMLRPAQYIEQVVYSQFGRLFADMKAAYPQDLAQVPNRVLSTPVSFDGVQGTMQMDHFFRAAHATGVLRYHTVDGHGEVPDLRATFVEIMDRFALTAAESFVWRWMQAAPSAGNAELSGGLIDVETASSNPRTAGMYVLSYTHPFGNAEFAWRAVAVRMMWESLRLNLSADQQALYNMGSLDFAQLHETLYSAHLAEQYLKATGLKDGVVNELLTHAADDAAQFRDTIHTLATMENPGSVPHLMTGDGKLLEDAEAVVTSRSVVDVFGFLGRWPQIYFDAAAHGEKPTLEQAVAALEPIYSSSPEVHAGQERNVRQHAHDLMVTYDRLMRAAETHGASHYDDASSMHADVAARAAFRNKPMDEVYYWRMRGEVLDTLVQTADPATGRTVMADRDYLWPAVHSKVELSKRNVDAMLRDGEVVSGDNGQVDLGVMMYGNTTYGIHADPTSGARQLFVHIPVGNVDGPYELNVTGNGMSLASIDGAKILYRMTENGQVVAQGEAQAARIEKGGHLYLGLDVPVSASAYGVFEATLEIPGGPSRRLFEYAYASPDNATVRDLAAKPK